MKFFHDLVFMNIRHNFYVCLLHVSLRGQIVQSSYHKCGNFHELVQHNLFFMNLFCIKLHLYVCLLYVSLSGPVVQTSYHKDGRHVAFYFHELVQHAFFALIYQQSIYHRVGTWKAFFPHELVPCGLLGLLWFCNFYHNFDIHEVFGHLIHELVWCESLNLLLILNYGGFQLLDLIVKELKSPMTHSAYI